MHIILYWSHVSRILITISYLILDQCFCRLVFQPLWLESVNYHLLLRNKISDKENGKENNFCLHIFITLVTRKAIFAYMFSLIWLQLSLSELFVWQLTYMMKTMLFSFPLVIELGPYILNGLHGLHFTCSAFHYGTLVSSREINK